MTEKLKVEMAAGRLDQRDLLLRLERRKDIAAVKAAGLNIPVLYYFVPPKDPEKDPVDFIRDALSFCRKQGWTCAALSELYYTEEVADLFRNAGIRPYVFSFIRTERILDAVKSGAYAASHFYDPDYIADLIG